MRVLAWCCCSLFFTAGIALLIVWGVVAPSDPVLYIERAHLSSFNLSTVAGGRQQALEYNLTVEMSLRNSNKRATICYRWNELSAYYDNLWLAKAPLPQFCQGAKNTTVLTAAFVGRSVVELTPTGVGFFETQRAAGVFVVDVGFYGRVRSRSGSTKWKYTSNLDSMCWMVVPLASNRTASTGNGGFASTNCYDIRPQTVDPGV